MEFNNLTGTPFFETGYKSAFKVINIDTSKTVRKVSMLICRRSFINGLRLVDDGGEYLVNATFKDEGDWITYQIPIGLEIVGMVCATVGSDQAIHKLGFLLWIPNPEVRLLT